MTADDFDRALARWQAMPEATRVEYRRLNREGGTWREDVPTDPDGIPLRAPDGDVRGIWFPGPGGYSVEELDQGYPHGETSRR